MKKLLTLSLLCFLLTSMTPPRKTQVLFFGDSITEMGMRPGGYIDRMQHWLDSTGKAGEFQLTGAGISGNKIYDLYLRMDSDVIARKPDIVFVYIGVNDVWHKTSSGTGTDLDKFGKFYVAVIKKLQAQKIQVVLCTPAVIGERFDNTNQQDGDLNAYSNAIRKLAAEMNCRLLDLRGIFMNYEMKHNLSNNERGILTSDRVHLNDAGNKLVAEEMMKLLGWIQ
jgi:lysophospholipase L1-like esterase